jgi:hypothetical protein
MLVHRLPRAPAMSSPGVCSAPVGRMPHRHRNLPEAHEVDFVFATRFVFPDF